MRGIIALQLNSTFKRLCISQHIVESQLRQPFKALRPFIVCWVSKLMIDLSDFSMRHNACLVVETGHT